MIHVVRAKLHGLRVTGADLDYHGSITLDPAHCDAVGIYPLEFVDIWNKANGARLSTYVIFGEEGSRCCILNGAAARLCQPGDEVIVAATARIEPEALYGLNPRVVTFDAGNAIRRRLRYEVFKSARRPFDFRIVEDTGAGAGDPAPGLAVVGE